MELVQHHRRIEGPREWWAHVHREDAGLDVVSPRLAPASWTGLKVAAAAGRPSFAAAASTAWGAWWDARPEAERDALHDAFRFAW